MPSTNGEALRSADMSLVIETLGRSPGSSVLSIGAAMFDPHGKSRMHEHEENHLYLVINSFDAQNHGLSVQSGTVQWWKDKEIWPDLAHEIHESPIGVVEACSILLKFMQQRSPRKVWCNSPKFHLELLRSLFKKARLDLPVEYRDERCYRTLMDAAYPNRNDRPKRPDDLARFKPHHALGDAIYQAHQIIVTHEYLALPGPNGPMPALNDDQARFALASLSNQAKDQLLLGLLTGKTSRLTRENVAPSALGLAIDSDPVTTSPRMRPR